MSLPDTPPPSPPFTIGYVATHGLDGLMSNFGLLVKTTWPAALLLGIGSALTILSVDKSDDIDVTSFAMSAAGMLMMLVGWIFMISFAVSWRRFLILGETPTIFYFGGGFWSYTGRILLAVLAFYGVLLGIMIPVAIIAASALGGFRNLMPNDDGTWSHSAHYEIGCLLAITIPLLLVLLITGIWWFARHMPYFTARAVEDTQLTWKQTSQLMRGQVWRYLLGSLIASLIVMVPQGILSVISQNQFGVMPAVIVVIASVLSQFVAFGSLTISATIGALFYKTLVRKDPLF